MSSSDYRAIARDRLAGNWGNAILVTFVASLLGGLITSSGFDFNLNLDEYVLQDLPRNVLRILMIISSFISLLGLIQLVFGGAVRLGYVTYLLKLHDRNGQPELRDLFSQFYRFGTGFCLAFLMGLYTFLWSLLFIIPGIIAAFRYAMAPYILAENPDMTASEAINASKELMDGNKADLFILELSFIGWQILNVFTLGIGSFWLTPYMNAAYTAFYRDIAGPRIIDAAE